MLAKYTLYFNVQHFIQPIYCTTFTKIYIIKKIFFYMPSRPHFKNTTSKHGLMYRPFYRTPPPAQVLFPHEPHRHALTPSPPPSAAVFHTTRPRRAAPPPFSRAHTVDALMRPRPSRRPAMRRPATDAPAAPRLAQALFFTLLGVFLSRVLPPLSDELSLVFSVHLSFFFLFLFPATSSVVSVFFSISIRTHSFFLFSCTLSKVT